MLTNHNLINVVKISKASQSKCSNIDIPHSNQSPKRKLKESLWQFPLFGETASRREEGSPICMHGPLWRRTGRFRVLPVLLLLHIASCCCTQYTAELWTCCTDSVSSVASTLGGLEPGLVAKAKIGHGEGRRSPRGSTARVLARQAPSANLMLTGWDQSSSCQTKSSQDQQKTSFHFQVNSKLRHDVTSLCHVNRCLTYICELLVFYTAWHETAFHENSFNFVTKKLRTFRLVSF